MSPPPSLTNGRATNNPLPTWVAVAYGVPFVWVGIQHFVNPASFEPIVPTYLGMPRFWVLFTGVTEIILGIGIMWSRTRHKASILMITQLCLLYLGNLHMWMNDVPFNGVSLSTTGHVIRAAIQVLLIVGAAWVGRLGPFENAARPRRQPE